MVALARGAGSPVEFSICPTFAGVIGATRGCDAVAVDMPIGLSADGAVRSVDLAAREMMPPKRKPSVFKAPPRSLLDARTPSEFQARHRAMFGRGAGLMVWGIVPKIREVDEAMTPALQERIVECHPETVFVGAIGDSLAPKKTAEGQAARSACLERWFPGITVAAANARKSASGSASLDDCYDAGAGLLAAESYRRDRRGGEAARRLPSGEPDIDERGLRMEMWLAGW